MNRTTLGLALALAVTTASTPALADKGVTKGKAARAFDVCVDANTGARLTSFPPSAGDRVTAAGMILPAGTVPADGSGDATCLLYAGMKVGTFFVDGTFVSSFAPNQIKLPQVGDDDLAYVQWHFRIDGDGAFDTAGPIKQFAQGGTYPQTITGGTGKFHNTKGEMTTKMLGAGGFQIRVFLPDND